MCPLVLLMWQVYEPGKGLKFHFDKDEQLLVAEGRMVHPLLSSVLYLTGDAGAGGEPRQGAPVGEPHVVCHHAQGCV
jgi:hypothetical protein